MYDCDKCGKMLRSQSEKYPWYSYYSPKGVPTDILWRYCNESKTSIVSFYGIDESFFGKAESDEEEDENIKEYNTVSEFVRNEMRKIEV